MKTKIETLIENNPSLILCFHIGRGGYLSFEGECKITDYRFIDPLFMNDEETQYTDCNGREVGLPVDNDGTGKIDIDGAYNTTYSVHVQELTEKEFDTIKARGCGFYGLSMYEFDKISYFEEEEEETE